ncbi:hypothetical protein BH11CYA1_BH11CYA1_09940 [soil metagenome]
MKNTLKAIICSMILFNALPVRAQDPHFVSATLIVNAPMTAVWAALKTQRGADSARRRVISNQGSDYVVEETFTKIPVLGQAVCRYSEHEIPGKGIEYKMISSDKFTAFEGEWHLQALAAGQTAVTLNSYVDTGLHLPFAAAITRENTKKSVDLRIKDIVQLVASEQKVHLALNNVKLN